MAVKFSKSGHRPDYFLLALIFILTVFGLIILASASSELGRIRFNDSYYYLKHQIFNGLLPGIIGFLAGYFIFYRYYRKPAFLFLLANLVLLGLVFTDLGVKTGGASRWLAFGPITFQPAELLKLTFIIYLAAWLANPKVDRLKNISTGLLPFFIICGLVAAFLVLQPAISMGVILLSSGLVVYFVSGARFRHIILAIFVGIIAFGGIIWLTGYRLERIATFFNPQADPEHSGYQINQALITIGSGKLLGLGYGQSTTKVNILPEPIGDSIFAIVGQELGFIGAASLVILFALLAFRLLWIAKKHRERFGQLILVGFAMIIIFQSFINMGAISGLLPLTGVPLPFVSYGGTALAVFLTIAGIAVNISKYS
jgi:cell division protein FtsW